MAISKKPRSSRSKRSTTTKKKTTPAKAKTYTILKKSVFDPTKKLSTQGKTRITTKTGAHLASRVALARKKRPTRIYLYRHKKIMVYQIKYVREDGKVKSASAKRIKTLPAKGKASSTGTKKKRKTKKRKTRKKKSSLSSCTCKTKGACKKKISGTKTKINKLQKELAILKRTSRRMSA